MKIIQLYSIAFGCPKINMSLRGDKASRGKGCPLSVVDTFTVLEKVNWVEELKDDDVKKILEYHSICFDKCL